MFEQEQDSNEEQINNPNVNSDGEQASQPANAGEANNADFKEGQIKEEQTMQPNIGLVREEQYDEADQSQSEQPVESGDDFSEEESLEVPDSKSPSSKKKKIIIIVAIVLVAILISGGLLFAADRIFDINIPFISGLFKAEISENDVIPPTSKETPEEVIGKMFSSFKDIKTSQDSFDLEIKNKDDNQVTTISAQGSRDLSIPEKKKIDYNFKINQSDSGVSVSLAFRYVDETAYIKLTEGSTIPMFDLSDLQNQWFYFGNQEKEDLGIISGSENGESGLNNNEEETISELFKEAKFFKTAESIEGDTIDSVPVFHYIVTLDADGFSEFVTKLEEAGQDKLDNQNLPIPFPIEKIDEMKDSIEKMGNMPVEIWIEKGTYFLRKVSVDNFEADVTRPDGTKGKADVMLNIELNNINDPVNIQAPEGGNSLEKIMQNLFEKLLGQMSLPQNGGIGFGTDMTKDDDGDGLTNQEEFFYNTDPANPDTDGDGFSDGDEVKNGYNPNGAGKLLTFSKGPISLSETEYNELLSTNITGYEPEGLSVNLGPAILEFTDFWNTNPDEPVIWLELKMIPLPNFNLGIKNGEIAIKDVLTKDGKDVYNAESTFESEDFKTFSFSEESYPVMHLRGQRSVYLSGEISEDDIASIRGKVALMLPIDIQTLVFSSGDVGVKKVIGDRTFILESIEGGKVTMKYKGPGNINFVSDAYDKDGNMLNYSYRTTGFPGGKAQDITYEDMYDGDVEMIKIIIPSEVVERVYPFELKK